MYPFFCHVIFTRHLFIADLSSFCTYAVLAGPLGDRFCNPHVVIFLLSKHHDHHHATKAIITDNRIRPVRKKVEINYLTFQNKIAC
jgi:hypothetical protein